MVILNSQEAAEPSPAPGPSSIPPSSPPHPLMMKLLSLGLLLLSLPASALLAQSFSTGDPFGAGRLAAPSPLLRLPDQAAATQKGPTTIDSQDMYYDGKNRVAIFTGADYGVYVKDPNFTVYCDKIGPPTCATRGPRTAARSPTPTPPPKARPLRGRESRRLQRAIAEGAPDLPVVIVQDKPAANGQQAEHDVGIAAKADYNADTGDIYLTGWPRVSKGLIPDCQPRQGLS